MYAKLCTHVNCQQHSFRKYKRLEISFIGTKAEVIERQIQANPLKGNMATDICSFVLSD